MERASWEQRFFDEVSAYVGMRPEHALALACVREQIAPAFPRIVERFYEAIVRSPGAHRMLSDSAQVARLKGQLTDWLGELFAGQYDAAYVQRHARIGRLHVRLRLEQRYVFAAVNVLRTGLHDALTAAQQSSARSMTHDAIDKILDLELAIMLETYAEDYAARLRDHERLATLGQMAGFIAHELRNPLAVMETSVYLLRKRLREPDEGVLRYLERFAAELSSAGTIISDLQELARDRPIVRKRVGVRTLIDEALAMAQPADGVRVELEVATDAVEASVDERQVRHLLSNLVANAVQALPGRSPEPIVTVLASREDRTLILSVDDNGAGIAEEVRHRLFEPLTSTRAKGFGLGLTLCRRIAERHGGEIRAEDRPDGGSRFVVRLPGAFGES